MYQISCFYDKVNDFSTNPLYYMVKSTVQYAVAPPLGITRHSDWLQINSKCFRSHFEIVTRCAYAQGRVKRLSPSIYLFVCGCVCRQKTRLFAVLPLENRHEIALYRSASQFIFFERCLESRTSLLSSAMAMGF